MDSNFKAVEGHPCSLLDHYEAIFLDSLNLERSKSARPLKPNCPFEAILACSHSVEAILACCHSVEAILAHYCITSMASFIVVALFQLHDSSLSKVASALSH